MSFQMSKIFRRVNNGKVFIEMIGYDPLINTDYYKFIEEQANKGYIQIIVNSQLMLKLLSYYFVDKGFNVESIDLMEEDDCFNESYKGLIEIANNNRAYFIKLIERLNFLFNEDCIEIFKISLKKRDEELGSRYISIQSNGIVRVEENKCQEEMQDVKIQIEKILNNA